MLRINANLFPRDGYFFKESDGTILRAEVGWAGVITRVRAYRKRAGLPEGNPEQEVVAQACARNPNHCVSESNEQEEQRRVVSLKGKLLGWLSKMVRQSKKVPVVFVSAELAKSRADICAVCPKNQSVAEGCSSCRAAMREMRQALIGARTIDKRLTGCVETYEDLTCAIWIEEQTIANDRLPSNCWRKRGV